MRQKLATLGGRGRFLVSANFVGVSRKGHVILTDVDTPAGREPHVWVEFSQWRAKLALPGDEVHIEAEARTYYSDSRDEFDVTLSNVRGLDQ
jgi:hypothetical protein